MKRRLILLTLVMGVVFACATSTLGPKRHIYRVENHNWTSATLIFECNGDVLDRVYQIGTGERRQGYVNLRGCTSPRFAVRLLSIRDVYISPYLNGWGRDAILDIRIENHLPQTSHMILSR